MMGICPLTPGMRHTWLTEAKQGLKYTQPEVRWQKNSPNQLCTVISLVLLDV